jgi:hypothetical protein
MTTIDDPARLHAAKLAWAHALVFGALGVVCYVSPETAFGDGAYLPLPRLAVLAFAAALLAVVILLIGSARSGAQSALKLALLAALALDVQLPIAILPKPPRWSTSSPTSAFRGSSCRWCSSCSSA